MIWSGVAYIGVGIACKHENIDYEKCYVVVNYMDTPNIYGQYLQNVHPLINP